jgi:hypothetical protein
VDRTLGLRNVDGLEPAASNAPAWVGEHRTDA